MTEHLLTTMCKGSIGWNLLIGSPRKIFDLFQKISSLPDGLHEKNKLIRQIIGNCIVKIAFRYSAIVYGGFLRDTISGQEWNDIDIQFDHKFSKLTIILFIANLINGIEEILDVENVFSIDQVSTSPSAYAKRWVLSYNEYDITIPIDISESKILSSDEPFRVLFHPISYGSSICYDGKNKWCGYPYQIDLKYCQSKFSVHFKFKFLEHSKTINVDKVIENLKKGIDTVYIYDTSFTEKMRINESYADFSPFYCNYIKERYLKIANRYKIPIIIGNKKLIDEADESNEEESEEID